jgi:hypothetical protein
MGFLTSQTQSGFPINSKVTMHDGTYKKIKDLVIGDKLKSIKISDLIINNNYYNINIDLENLETTETLVTNVIIGNAFNFTQINEKIKIAGNICLFSNLDSKDTTYSGEEDPEYTNYNWGCIDHGLINNRNKKFEYLLNDSMQKERIVSVLEKNKTTRVAIIQTQPESVYFVNGFAVLDRFTPIKISEGK